MKKLNFALLLLIASCSTPDKKEIIVQGAYKRLSEILNDGKKDTVMQATQNKIYTTGHLIFAGITSDSIDYFGFGKYSIDSGKVQETIFFTSIEGATSGIASTFALEITKSDKGFKQVIRNVQTTLGVVTLTEEYENAGNGKSFWLDGAWRCTKAQTVKNGDTTTLTIDQYKFYESGRYVYGHTYGDSTGVNVTGIGYGPFEVVNDSTTREIVTLSTYDKPGSTFLIDLDRIDDSHYRQMVTHGDIIFVEEYERIAKRD